MSIHNEHPKIPTPQLDKRFYDNELPVSSRDNSMPLVNQPVKLMLGKGMDLRRRPYRFAEQESVIPVPTPEELLTAAIEKLTIEVNSEAVVTRLERLKQVASRPIPLLSPEHAVDLEAMKKLSRSAYGTPAYALLYAHVLRIFGPEKTAEPFTVGAFFIGSSIPTNLTTVLSDVNVGCSLLASNGLAPSEGKWSFCNQNVIWCLLSSTSMARNSKQYSFADGYCFIRMNNISSSNKAILFVDSDSYDSFPGFSKREKSYLMNQMRLYNVKLLSTEQGVSYTDLIGKTIKVQALKTRAEKPRSRRQSGTNKVQSSWKEAFTIMLMLLVLVVVVICAVKMIRSMRAPMQTKRRRATKHG
jgi:hypothetical protein